MVTDATAVQVLPPSMVCMSVLVLLPVAPPVMQTSHQSVVVAAAWSRRTVV